MSKIDKLIKELCPNGTKYFRIEDLFIYLKGMTGVTGKWKDEGNCKFIDYKNVYKNISVNVNELHFATIKKLSQNTLLKGDILFTSASEVSNECAISSVVEQEISPNVFIDDHLFGLRIKNEFKNKYLPGFYKYYFRSTDFRKKLVKVVRGVTRFYISKPDFLNIFIPLPPIEIQNEIVKTLDKFTELTKELTKELTARKKQYEYYRNELLTFKNLEREREKS